MTVSLTLSVSDQWKGDNISSFSILWSHKYFKSQFPLICISSFLKGHLQPGPEVSIEADQAIPMMSVTADEIYGNN